MIKQINKEEIMNEVFQNMEVQDDNFLNARKMKSYFMFNGDKKEIDIIFHNSVDDLLKKANKEIDKIISFVELEKEIKELVSILKNKHPKEEVISSLGIEDYLESYMNNPDNSLKDKIIMGSFLNEYIDKPLYVVEFFRGKCFYIRVENSDDEIVSGELFLGLEIEKEENEFNFDMNLFDGHIINRIKEQDKFLFENLDKFDNKHVGYKIKTERPITDNTMIGNYTIKYTMDYKFIGFDKFQEIAYWLNEGYYICEKSDLEKVRGLI